MAEVADARVQDANEILEKQSKSVDQLERVTGHVKTLVDLMEVAAEVSTFLFSEVFRT